MRVNGEAYFLLNFWVDLLSLLVGARLSRIRFRLRRALRAAALGGAYALLAAMGTAYAVLPMGGAALTLPVALTACVFIAYGKRGLCAVPAVAAAGLFFAGCGQLWLAVGLPGPLFCPAAGLAALVACRLPRAGAVDRPEARLTVRWSGKTVCLPVLRDSGNALRDPLTGLPVVVMPVQAARALLPRETDPDDLNTLPRGFRLLFAATAAGDKALMCFRPECVTLNGREIDAVIALSSFREKRAVVPETLIRQEAKRHGAIAGDSEMDAAVFCEAEDRETALHRWG